MATFSWDELPDIEDVHGALRAQADIRAKIRIAKLRLEMYQAELIQKKPRDSSVKFAGIDEPTKKQLTILLTDVAMLEGQLDQVDADVKFNDYRKEAAKVVGYRTRL